MTASPACNVAAPPPLALRSWSVRRMAGLGLRVAGSAGLFAAAIHLAPATIEWRELAAVGPGALAAALGLFAAIVALLAWRWRRVSLAMAADRASVPELAAFARMIWIGLAVNQVLPSVVGGDAARIGLLARHGVGPVAAAASVVVDRAYGLAGLAVLCGLGAATLVPSLSGAALAAAAAIAAGVAVLVALRDRLPARLNGIARLAGAALSGRAALVLVPAAALGHVANIMTFLVIAWALGLDLPVLATVAVMSAVLLIAVLPISVAGWGVRELTLVQAFGYIGVVHDQLVLASVAYGLFQLLTQTLGFALLVGRNRS